MANLHEHHHIVKTKPLFPDQLRYLIGRIVEPDCGTLVALADFFESTTDYILGRVNILQPLKVETNQIQNELLTNLPGDAIKELESIYFVVCLYKF